MIKNLVFSGAGTKLYSFLGFVKALKQNKLLDNIESIIGSSAGAFVGLLLCLKYDYDEIEKLLLKIKLDKFNNLNVDDILNFFENFGIETGDKFKNILNIIVKAKTGDNNCTFKQLYEQSNINLIITSTCLNTLSCEYLNHKSHPDMNIIDAIMMSISIPFYLKPYIYDNKYYVDGSLLNHYPIDYFKNETKYTLGIMVTEKIKETKKIDSFYDYLYIILSCSFLFNIKNCYECYKNNTVLIENNDSFINFNIEYNTKVNLINQAFEKTSEFIKSDCFVKNYEIDIDIKDKN